MQPWEGSVVNVELEAQCGHHSGLLLPTQQQIVNAVLGPPLSSEERWSLQLQDQVSWSIGWQRANQSPSQSDAQASCAATDRQETLGPGHRGVQITGFHCCH